MIFITGATGKIGRPLVHALLARGERVRALVRDPAHASLPPGVELVHGDILDPVSLAGAMAGCRVVHHLAAHVEEGDTADEALAARLRRVNVEGSLHVARAALQEKVVRLVHMSSYAVYGYRSGDRMNANTPVSLDTPYGRSKWEAEEALRTALGGTSLDLIILRPVVVTGAPRDEQRHDLIADLVRMARKGFLPCPIGAGPARKALVHLDDVIAGLLAAQERGPRNRTYVIAASRSFPFIEILTTLSRLLGHRVSVPAPAHLLRLGAWLSDVCLEPIGVRPSLNRRRLMKLFRDQVFDISHERTDLGYQPTHADLEEMLRPYVG
jgi:nucleoside-diphosphate-sugar epimerase